MKAGVTKPIRNVEIIPAKNDDAKAVAQVYADSWPRSVEHAATVDVREDLLKMRGVAFWEGEIRRPPSHQGQFLVARRGAQLVGFAGSTSEPDGRWELVWLFVKPEMHGRGVGAQLHGEMIAGSTRARPTERLLWAVPGNRRAERFYADRGWRPTTSIKDVETPSGTFPLRNWILPM
jgi:GNAT superfamily N-acetyltransferase